MSTPQHRTSLALVVFSVIDGQLRIILKKGELPRLLVTERTKLDTAAASLARRLIGDGGYLEQLYTFSPRTKENSGIVASYFLLVASYSLPKHILEDFVSVTTKPNNALDTDIIAYAIQRLRWKVEYTNVVYSLLPEEFTLSELQRTYEAILGRLLDKRNFRKKILTLGILKDIGKKARLGRARPAYADSAFVATSAKEAATAGRPAEVYAFKERKLTYVEVL